MTDALLPLKPSLEGYYQYPALYQNTVLFVSEGDLWRTSDQGGRCERLSSGLGAISAPTFSPDGRWIAFTGTQEGRPELYLMDARGGVAKRLTYFDQHVQVLGWLSYQEICIKSNHETAFHQVFYLYAFSIETGQMRKLDVGAGNALAQNAQGQRVLQRHGYGYVNWKRYRGGTAGELWIETAPERGDFHKILHLKSNNIEPTWVGSRLYFLSDHEGHGDIYSCLSDGSDLKRHTTTTDFYVRHMRRGASLEDTRLIYRQGADLFILDTDSGATTRLSIIYPSACFERARRFASSTQNLTSYSPSPQGQEIVLTTRGRLFKMPAFKGPVEQCGEREGIRYRAGRWLSKTHLIAVKDKGREEILEVFDTQTLTSSVEIQEKKWGRILNLFPSPLEDGVLITNHRHELWHVTFKNQKSTLLDQSKFGPFLGVAWSPDGRWAAYSIQVSRECSILRLINLKTKEKTDLTTPLFQDFAPCFDPQGKFIYFLSFRTFSPQKDALKFDWAFQDGVKPYLITLHKDQQSPFILPAEAWGIEHSSDAEDTESKTVSKEDKTTEKIKPVTIDLEGIQDRLLPFPVPAGSYSFLEAGEDKVYWLMEVPSFPDSDQLKEESEEEGQHLQVYDFAHLKCETLVTDAQTMALSRDSNWLMYTTPEKKMRLIKAGEKPEEHDISYKAGGWIDETRIRLEVLPEKEWLFMFQEAWRLQKDLFWREDMGEVDWEEIRLRYLPLVDRVNTPAELMDVIYEMQGELGVSHAYVWDFDEGEGASYKLGHLGASFAFDATTLSWRVTRLDRGKVGELDTWGPLQTTGLNIKIGTHVWAVDGQKVSMEESPEKLLVNKAEVYVSLRVSDNATSPQRNVWVKTLRQVRPVRYADWIEKNRAYVEEKTQGRIGYIHIPDMVEEGFAAFFQSYMREFDKEGLILDIRFNNGGNISTILLSILARKRLGFDQTRYDGQVPYLTQSPRGPMVALCNQSTASDGDMFAYSFQKLGLGPLIGKRTWGGVIGMFARHPLLDGTMTSQPEYAIWFHDIGWRLENRGAEPDIEVDITPQEEALGQDPQLDRAIQEVLNLVPCEQE